MKPSLLMLAILLTTAPTLSESRRLSATLVRVVDGDTLRLNLHLEADVTLRNQAVRLLGLDAPELHQPRGPASRRALSDFLRGKELAVELHGKDRYGRWLADLFADAENVALWMLREKHAKVYQAGVSR